MQLRQWLENQSEDDDDIEVPLRVVLKSGNELEIIWVRSLDAYGTDDEITNGNYMIDARSIAAIQFIG
jgi:hypothetical protein